MTRKIVLFLSERRSNAEKKTYRCPDGTSLEGTQTNEAPVKYLLRTYSDISDILCIVTPEAEKTALAGFRGMAAEEAPGAVLRTVPFQTGQDFSDGALHEIVSDMEQGDEILLDTTGGFRNAIMDLLLLSRVLSYKGVQTICAVYSNFKTGQVEDVSRLIGMFELVGGMQELTRFGSVSTLRRYYQAQPADKQDQKITNLLTAMERLTETITLCRTRLIDQRMEQFDSALCAAEDCDDPLMRALLPVFRSKFGKKLTTPGLIKWCVESDMLQQALTIYKERIPAYILRERKDLLTVRPNAPAPSNLKDYEDEEEARFYEHLLKMGANMCKVHCRWDTDTLDAAIEGDYTVMTLERFEDLLPHSYFVPHCPVSQLREIAMDYLYIRALRNMINHANERETDSQKRIMDYLSDYRYKRLEDVTAENVRQTILQSLKHLQPRSRKEKTR